MKVLRLENNVFLKECPCCQATSLTKLGVIRYARETYYSSSRVELSHSSELWCCETCNSGFTQNRISEQDSIKLYSLGYGWKTEKFCDAKAKESVRFIDSWIQSPCKVLDIGCANGAFLDYIRRERISTFGLEYSTFNLNQLDEKKHIAYSDWHEVDEHFNVITAFDVVEHLYNLKGFLNRCYDCLTEDGVLILLTGDISSSPARNAKADWWYVKHPEHIIFPSQSYFSSLSKFKVVDALQVYPRKFHPPNRSILKEIAKLSKAALKNCFLNSYYPLPFMPKDHLIIVLQKVRFSE